MEDLAVDDRRARPHRPYRVGVFCWLVRALFLWGLVFAFMLLMSVLLATVFSGGAGTAVGDWVAFLVVAVPFLGAYLVFTFQMARIGMYVSVEGIVVRGLRGKRTFPWSEVSGVEVVPMTDGTRSWVLRRVYVSNPMARRASCPCLRLANGEKVVVDDLNSSVPTWFGSKPEEIVRRLEASRPC